METVSTSLGGDSMTTAMGGGDVTASITAQLVDKSQRDKETEDVAEEIRKQTDQIAGASIGVSAVSSIMGMSSFGSSGISLTIEGSDLDQLEALSDQLAQALSQVDGLREIETSMQEPTYEVALHIDRQRALQFGLTGAQVAAQVREAVSGSVATTLKQDGQETDVRLAYPDRVVGQYNDLSSLPIQTAMGTTVPLSAMAEISLEQVPASIMRQNQTRYATVSAEVYGRDLGSASEEVQQKIDEISLPAGYTIAQTGAVEMMEENFADLYMVIVMAVALVYMVMAAQFESLRYPFIILFTIPLALMGVFFLLFVTGETLTMISLIGVLVLVGIVVNNGIVLIDYITQLRENQGLSAEEAVKKACPVRLRPILMTALTTILGQIPMVFSRASSAEMLRGMGLTVIGGLLVSTVLTLVVVPILYLWMSGRTDRRREKKAKRQEKRQARIERQLQEVGK